MGDSVWVCGSRSAWPTRTCKCWRGLDRDPRLVAFSLGSRYDARGLSRVSEGVDLDSVTEDGVMSRLKSPPMQFAVYVAVRIIVCILQALSSAAASGFARCLAWLAYHVDRRHREVALD